MRCFGFLQDLVVTNNECNDKEDSAERRIGGCQRIHYFVNWTDRCFLYYKRVWLSRANAPICFIQRKWTWRID